MKYIVVNADDLGFSPGTNTGIEDAHREGILTSASIMPTGPSFRKAVQLSKRNPDLGIGVHLSLTLGKSILSKHQIPDLIDEDGYFYANSLTLLIKTLTKPRAMKHQIALEFDAQIQAVKKAGIPIDHLNSQYHVHCIPLIFEIVCTLARTYNIPIVRNSREALWTVTSPINMIKFAVLHTYGIVNDIRGITPEVAPRFYGILNTRAMPASAIASILTRNDTGIVEILTHPGVYDTKGVDFDYDHQGITFFIASDNRKMELEELKRKELKEIIKKNKLTITTFGRAYKMIEASTITP